LQFFKNTNTVQGPEDWNQKGLLNGSEPKVWNRKGLLNGSEQFFGYNQKRPTERFSRAVQEPKVWKQKGLLNGSEQLRRFLSWVNKFSLIR
jgi:hypothetical protein